MKDSNEALQGLRSTLGPYIKPREQVNYIRRILAIHLGTCCGDGPIQQPLSLVNSTLDIRVAPDLKGVYREYIESLRENSEARRQFDDVLQTSQAKPADQAESQASSIELLEERLCLLRLHQKRDSLLAVRESLDLLVEKPAAMPDFLNIKQMLHGTPDLPSIPKDVINSLVVEQSTPQPDLASRLNQLEKTVLRAKLQLKQEEHSMREAKARSKSKHEIVSNGARLEALNVTRNELITWIETELGKASQEAADEGTHDSQDQDHHSTVDTVAITTRLEKTHKKYEKYVASRRALLALVAQQPQTSLPPPTKQHAAEEPAETELPGSTDYLVTPYIKQLIQISSQQKAILTHKTYINTVLSKQNQDISQLLGRLADESHLLPSYPTVDSPRRRSSAKIVTSTRSSEQADISTRIRPWVFAADSAKIATLESVAEHVEGGQVALENSMGALQDLCRLIDRDPSQLTDGVVGEDPSQKDAQFDSGRRTGVGGRRHTVKKSQDAGLDKSGIWSKLHGSLGLIGHEDTA